MQVSRRRLTNAGKSFAWTFDGVNFREIGLGSIAPEGFEAGQLKVYVGVDMVRHY